MWAEVEMGDDVNWQAEALSRADITKGGKINSKSAAIVDQIPHGGHYRFKTNPNMAGTWLIGGELKVNRIIDNPELLEISQSLGSSDLPSLPKLIQEKGLSLKELNAESIRELKVYYPKFLKTLGRSAGVGSLERKRLERLLGKAPDDLGIDALVARRSDLILQKPPMGSPAHKELVDITSKVDKFRDGELGRLNDKRIAGDARRGLDALNNLDDVELARLDRAVEQGFDIDAYHGTAGDIKSFDPGLLGSTTGAPSARKGFFFAAEPKTAETFAKNAKVGELNPERLRDANRANESRRAQMTTEVQSLRDQGLFDEAETLNDNLIDFVENNLDEIPEGLGQNIIPAKLRMETPLIHDFEGKSYREVSYHDLLEKAQSSGYDSAIFRNTRDGGPITDIYVVFEPSQIRSRYAAFNPADKSTGTGDITATMPPVLFPIGLGAAAAAFSVNQE